MSEQVRDTANDVAIVGMEGRFPGAPTLDRYWQNLRDGIESVTFSSDVPPIVASGVAHVKAAPLVDGIELFDAGFFGFNPREAEGMDPQVRLFLEVAWAALESAGIDPARSSGRIGVFAGCALSTYLTAHLLPNPDAMRGSGSGLSSFGQFNDRDSLATIASYKLDLTGPSVTVQTFCSTSLVAVHMACQSLLGGESDVALAGASSINVLLQHGYAFQEGGILSPDGHTRTFDADAGGTVFGNGVGVVVLKRLEDALRDRDVIHAVLRGSAINNDGARKAGYTAPSVGGQATAIAEAIAVAQVDPVEISYVEAHGTATAVGDPIEIEALTRAFRAGTDKKRFCAIGSAKTNFGHLDRAAGIAGLIKVALSLKHRQIPPTLHFKSPNPKIDFDNSPFYVNTQLAEWKSNGAPRVAGISALGVGGTNAHVIVEEAPAARASGPSKRPAQLLVLSARSEAALDAATDRLAAHLRASAGPPLADVAYTLLEGRHRFEHRRVVVASDGAAAGAALEARDPKRVATGYARQSERPVAFLFPGQGAQYVGMGRELYESEAVFRESFDACLAPLSKALGLDLEALIFADPASDDAAERLRETRIAQPALFAVEYAVARQWMAWGIQPESMIGHSIGEYVAAHLAGVFSLEDALRLVVERGRLMQSMPAGAMIAAALPVDQVTALLTPGLELAAVNAPGLCVAAGTAEAVAAFELRLEEQGLAGTRLHTSHAFHTAMMEPILEPFRQVLQGMRLAAPRLPYVSNVSGTWITAEQATDPAYWAEHLRRTVRFSQGIETLRADPERILLEVGPGHTLCTLARQHAAGGAEVTAIPSMRHPRETDGDQAVLLGALGRLWIGGAAVDGKKLFAGEDRRRVELPTYAFDRKKFWIDAPIEPYRRPTSGKRADVADWTYVPTWRSALPPRPRPGERAARGWLVFADAHALGAALAARLRASGGTVVTATMGGAWGGDVHGGFQVRAGIVEDYERLLGAVQDAKIVLTDIVHAWSVGPERTGELSADVVRRAQESGYYSALFLAKALAEQSRSQPVHLHVLTSQVHGVLGTDRVHAERSMVLGLAKVVPQEQHDVTTSCIDVEAPGAAADDPRTLDALVVELQGAESGAVTAYRAGQRFVQDFVPLALEAPAERPSRLRERGVYLITGGLGGVTFILAAYLAHAAKARLVLTGRARLPERAEWTAWLAAHGEADPVSLRIRRVQLLEQWGAEVHLVSADVGHEEDMRSAIRQTEERFGAVNGVIHGAGVVGGNTFRPLQQIGPDECETQFHPKVTGLLVLEKVLGDRPLDFCLLTSSLSSLLGGYAYGAYAPANVFMDVFTEDLRRRRNVPWISVNWDEWRLSEEAVARPAGVASFAMAPAEGASVFARILHHEAGPCVVVSSGDLQARIRQWVRLEGLRESKDGVAKKETRCHPRPNLQNAYVAPGTPAEEAVARIWADHLGIEKVGIQDNFFDIGGHSLLAIQVITSIRAELKAEISVASLFEGPTVESLCRIITGGAAAGSFEQSSERGQKRKDERRRRQVERYEEVS